MTKQILKISLVFLLSCFFLSCDKDQNAVFDAALDRLEPEIEAAATPEDKIELLERFRSTYEGHPKIATIRARIDALKNVEEKAQIKEEKLGYIPLDLKVDIEKGAFEAMAKFSLAAIAQRSRQKGDSIDEIILPGFKEVHPFNKASSYTSPSKVRSLVLRSMYKTDKKWMARCDAKCQNLYVNKVIKGTLGEALFKEDGSMNPAGVEKLLTLMKGDSFGGVKYSDLYKVYGPSISRILAVREKIRKIGDAEVMKSFNDAKAKDPKSLPKWYRTFTSENDRLKALSLRQYPISRSVGFWIRRMDDKTADPIEKFLKTLN